MDRKRSSRSFDQGAMCTHRIAQSQLLLSSCSGRCDQSRAHETHRRDLYRTTLQWLQGDRSEIAQGRIPGQPQTNPRTHAKAWIGWDSARAKHIQEPSRTSQIPLSFAWPFDSATFGRVEYGHHVYPPARRLCLPCSSHRLVQPPGSCISPLKQSGRRILLGRLRRSCRVLWKASDFQYRSRRAVFFAAICQCHIEQRDPIQHGWAWASSRQHLCGAPMEVGKI